MMLRAIAQHVTAAPAAAAEIVEEPAAEPSPPIEIEPLHEEFGARLHNVDLENLTEEQWETIEDAFNNYGVIVIAGQGDNLDPKALTDLARRFHREDPTECVLTRARRLWSLKGALPREDRSP
jgi:hypothetical protein